MSAVRNEFTFVFRDSESGEESDSSRPLESPRIARAYLLDLGFDPDNPDRYPETWELRKRTVTYGDWEPVDPEVLR